MQSYKKMLKRARSSVRPRNYRLPRAQCEPSELLELSKFTDQQLGNLTEFIKCKNIISLPIMPPEDPRALLVICAQIIEVKRALLLLPNIGEEELKDIVYYNLSAHESVRCLVDELCMMSKSSRILIQKNLRFDFQKSLEAGLDFLECEFSDDKYNRSVINYISLYHDELERDVIWYILERSELLSSLLPWNPRENGECSIQDITEHLAAIHPVKALQKCFSPNSSFFDSGLIDLEESSISSTEKWGDVELEFTGNLHDIEECLAPAPSAHFKWKRTFDPTQKIDDVILPKKEKRHLLHLLADYQKRNSNEPGKRLTFLFKGAPGTGKSMAAEAIAQNLGMKVLRIQMGEFDTKSMPNLISFATARAQNKNIMLLFDECESLIWRDYRLGIASPWMKMIFEDFKGVACFTTNYPVPGDFLRRITYYLDFKSPTAEIRSHILKKELEKISEGGTNISAITPLQIKEIASDFSVPGGFYQQALHLAKALESENTISETTLRESLSSLEEKLNFEDPEMPREPKIKLEQVHLDPVQKNYLSKMIEFARKKSLPGGIKISMPRTALFYGPPGTGKTMTAEALAFELGLKIKTVTPSSFLNPYVGQTEKKIREIFRNAQADECVLFIDEAEGLLLDRTNSRSSWEKTQTDEFLHQIENFSGILIAATNWTSIMDPAYARRFLFHIEFREPEASTRLAIWNSFKDVLNIPGLSFDNIATKYQISGGEIRNVALKCLAYGIQDPQHLEELCLKQICERTGERNKIISI